MSYRALRLAQLTWANAIGLRVDERGYVKDPADNLFLLSKGIKADFERGSGGEFRFGKDGQPPKICALHSSAALACNAFGYWRENGLEHLGKIFQLSHSIERLEFEAQFPTGLSREPPNLDIALFLRSGEIVGIESKFCEPSYRSKSRSKLKDKYFKSGKPIWETYGLTRCARLATSIRSGVRRFEYFDAPQMLKHALGLTINTQSFQLYYIYFENDGAVGVEHRRELDRFMEAIGDDFKFRSLTYSELIAGLRAHAGALHTRYFDYFATRYRLPSTQGSS